MQAFRKRKSSLSQQNNCNNTIQVSGPIPLASQQGGQQHQEGTRAPLYDKFARSTRNGYNARSSEQVQPTISSKQSVGELGSDSVQNNASKKETRNVVESKPPPPPKDPPSSKLSKTPPKTQLPTSKKSTNRVIATPHTLLSSSNSASPNGRPKYSPLTAFGLPTKKSLPQPQTQRVNDNNEQLEPPSVYSNPDASPPRSSQERLIDEIQIINQLLQTTPSTTEPQPSPQTNGARRLKPPTVYSNPNASPPRSSQERLIDEIQVINQLLQSTPSTTESQLTPKANGARGPKTSSSADNTRNILSTVSPATPTSRLMSSESLRTPKPTHPQRERLIDETDLYSNLNFRYTSNFSSQLNQSPLSKRSLDLQTDRKPKLNGNAHRSNQSMSAAIQATEESEQAAPKLPKAASGSTPSSALGTSLEEKYNLSLKDPKVVKTPVISALDSHIRNESVTPSLRKTLLAADSPSTASSQPQGKSGNHVGPWSSLRAARESGQNTSQRNVLSKIRAPTRSISTGMSQDDSPHDEQTEMSNHIEISGNATGGSGSSAKNVTDYKSKGGQHGFPARASAATVANNFILDPIPDPAPVKNHVQKPRSTPHPHPAFPPAPTSTAAPSVSTAPVPAASSLHLAALSAQPEIVAGAGVVETYLASPLAGDITVVSEASSTNPKQGHQDHKGRKTRSQSHLSRGYINSEQEFQDASVCSSPPLPSLPPPSPTDQQQGDMLTISQPPTQPPHRLDLDFGKSGIPGLLAEISNVSGSNISGFLNGRDKLSGLGNEGRDTHNDESSTITGTFKTAIASFSTVRQGSVLNRKIDEFGIRKSVDLSVKKSEVRKSVDLSAKKSEVRKSVDLTLKKSDVPFPSPGPRVSKVPVASLFSLQSKPTPTAAPVSQSTTTLQKSKVSYNPMPSQHKSLLAEFGVPRSSALSRPPSLPEPEPEVYPLVSHLKSLPLLIALLPHLTFADFLAISKLNTEVENQLNEDDYKEEILERYLGSVGYWRWSRIFGSGQLEVEEPLALTLQDLNCYMRAVAIPPHRYADYAQELIAARQRSSYGYRPGIVSAGSEEAKLYARLSRSYTRVVLRLRAQAEAEAEYINSKNGTDSHRNSPTRYAHSVHAPSSYSTPSRSRCPSRPGSRADSVFSNEHYSSSRVSLAASLSNQSHQSHQSGRLRPKFRSTLYRPKHAPLFRVFVLSPEGPWMSDDTMLDCEAELKRACIGAKGRMSKKLLRVGDVVWNCAIGDEANLGRSIWDGNFLIDLEYTFSKMGAVPRYLHSLSFPPSYFHRIIHCGSGIEADPIVQIDISPFGEQIAVNLQLLQERVAMDTPQGGRHTVLRWTHRSFFRIPSLYRSLTQLNIPIPNTHGMFVHADWAGAIVVEAEGTNEGLAELQARCGTAFPQFRKPAAWSTPGKSEVSRVFRLLRERSKPGEIWIRLVREKDRVM